MSIAPRPHTNPSTTAPENGSRVQPSTFTGTTSVWPMRSSDGAFGSLPSMRATRLWRPGCGSKISWSPTPDRYCERRSTLRVSSPDAMEPSFTHWLRMSSWRRSVTSAVGSSACVGIDPTLSGGARVSGEIVELLERVLDTAREHLEVGRGSTVAHEAEVELAAVRHHSDVDGEVP